MGSPLLWRQHPGCRGGGGRQILAEPQSRLRPPWRKWCRSQGEQSRAENSCFAFHWWWYQTEWQAEVGVWVHPRPIFTTPHHFSAHPSPSHPHATCQDHFFQELRWWPWLSPSRHPDQKALIIDCFPVSTETQLVFWQHHRLNESVLWAAGCCGSVAQLCPTLCDPMDCSTPGFLVLHHLPEFAQTQVHWVRDAIQPLTLCRSLLLLSSIFPSIKIFSNVSALHRLPRWR